ncbi:MULTISPECIES: type II toxin-antitoxin system VapC family toxin [Maricaulis]|jgi:predicted nucleic acid-binding protein|uniref:type II toxin-antitoxin system VapC family toxin n=1 Tax=Maricaulis TaxID=74317 RepID=UPI000C5BC718|nr:MULTISPECIES: type II toxin-antitoxin system VapC family toxin [Maricaulis]MAC88153.1 hypothetical protein [Maricaulis sp.]
MKPLVVDASAAAGWLLRQQGNPRSDAFLARNLASMKVAPDIFNWEIINLLRVHAERRAIDFDVTMTDLDTLGIETVEPRGRLKMRELALFALQTRLSLFDAAYLALAVELDGEIVSRDASLLNAAARLGVANYDIRAIQ